MSPWLAASSLQAQVTSIAAHAPTLSSVAAWNVRTDSSGVGIAAPSLTLLITAGSVQHLPNVADNAITAFPTPVSITTQWQQLTGIIGRIDLVGYFAAPASALSNGSAAIPSSRVQGRMASGRVAAFTAFTQAPVSGLGTPGGSLHLFRQFLIIPINANGQRTDALDLRLDLVGFSALVPGTYLGTLNLRAVVF